MKPPGGGSRAPCSRAHTEAAERNLVPQIREKRVAYFQEPKPPGP